MASCYYVEGKDGRPGRWRIQSRLLPAPRSWSSAPMKKSRREPPEVLAKLAEFEARERALGQHGRRKAAGSERDRPLADWLAEYRARYAARHRPGSARRLELAARRMLGWAGTQGLKRVRDLGRDRARAYVAWLVAAGGAGLKGETAKVEIAYLSGCWSEAGARDEALANPWRRLAPDAPASDPRRPSWTWEQYEQLLPHCPGWLRRLVVLGCHTGLRIGELKALRWGWIEWGDARYPWGVLRVPAAAAKSGKAREVPLHRTAHDLLAPEAGSPPDAPVLTWPGGRAIRGTGDVHEALGKACARAGVPFGATHCMRRSFGRWAVQGVGPWKGAPVPMRIAQSWLGHASLETTEAYLAIEERVSDAYMNPGRLT